MELVEILKQRRLAAALGYGLFLSAAAAGYFYNLTFVQLGLVDLGTRVLALPEQRVAGTMALLAGLTLVVAVATGLALHRTGQSADLVIKLRVLTVAVALQTVLTGLAPHLTSSAQLTAWVVVASVALGLGVPSMFGLTCDLVPVRDRGWVAGLATSAAYLPAALLATDWTIERFAAQLLPLLAVGAVGMAVLAFVPQPLTRALALQHLDPGYGQGRFTRRQRNPGSLDRPFGVALLLLFGVYFVDSLGFLRIIDTPVYMVTAWHSAALDDRVFIAGAHVLAAVLAGILYPALSQRALFGWVFALFALAQLNWVLHQLTTPELAPSLAMPVIYAMAVSIYTVLSFTLWPDLSTPATIARNTAIGVGVSGWFASFASTALAMWWRTSGMAFDEHLRAVAAISLVLLGVVALLLVLPAPRRKAV